MRLHVHTPTLTIASGGTASGTIGQSVIRYARSIAIFAPATLTETVTVKVTNDGGSSYKSLQSGGTDITIAAGKAIIIDAVAFDDLRLEAGSAVGADRVFTTHMVEES